MRDLQQLFKELGLDESPATIYEDNLACVQLAKDPVQREKAKHIDVRYHLIRDEIEIGHCEVKWISTKEQLGDGFTKVVPLEKLNDMKSKIGLIQE